MVKQFNVGDRVRFLSKDGYILDDNQMSGVVTDATGGLIEVDVDNYPGNELLFFPGALEKVTTAPKKVAKVKFLGIPLFTIEGDAE